MRRATGTRHLAEGHLAAAAAGTDWQREALERGLRHLGRRCPRCRGVLAEYPERAFGPRRGESEAAAGMRAPSAAGLLRELAEAHALMEELEEQPDAGRAAALAAASPRFHTCGLAWAVLDAAQGALDETPGDALSWLVLARVVAERLDPARYSAGAIATLRARVHAAASGVLAAAEGDRAAAASELARAETLARDASDSELVAVELGLSQARLELASGRWDRALERCHALEEPTRTAGLTEHRVRARRLAAEAARRGGRLEEALDLCFRLRDALRSTGLLRAEEARVDIEIGASLVGLGLLDRALRVLDEAGPRIAQWQQRTRSLRALWAGIALRRLGRWEEAEDALQASYRGLAEAAAPWDSLEALLEIALCYLGSGRGGELDEVMDQMGDLHRIPAFDEATRAFLFRLQVATWKGDLDEDVVGRFRATLATRRSRPDTGRQPH